MDTLEQHQALTRWMTLLFAFACGTIIANIYYAQPLLDVLATTFHRSPATLGFIVTATQIGYALGLLLIVPLGDVVNRRRLIVLLLSVNVLALVAVATSTNYTLFVAAYVIVGLTTSAAQLLIPFAASLASPEQRGRTIGKVMMGLLLGILLARTFSGAIAQASNWRAVYGVAAALTTALTILLAALLPQESRNGPVQYCKLMLSIVTLVRENPPLVLRSAYGALIFACFSMVWTGLTFLLTQAPYGYSEGTIGLFGLVGACGTLAASYAGRLSDRGYGNAATGSFAAVILGSFVILASGTHSLAALLVGIVLLDIGVQGLHISNQSVIYSLAGDARSRVTTVYLTSFYVGAAIGSTIASTAFSAYGWEGVCLAGAAFAVALLLLWARTQRAVTAVRGPAND